MAVDTAAGTATVVGESGLDTAEHSLAFDAEDTLYLVNYDGVYIIDTTTGDGGESIGTIDFSSHPDYELAHHGDFNPDTGMLWALDTTNDYTSTRNILVVDLDDFIIEDIISTIDDLHVLVFAYQ